MEPLKPLSFPGANAKDAPPEHLARCGNCRFWDPTGSAGPEQDGATMQGTCRRFPPVIAVIPVNVPRNPRVIITAENAERQMQLVPTPMSVRASTNEADWCGEYAFIPRGVGRHP